MRAIRLLVSAALLTTVVGCHSAFINASVRNFTDKPISLVEVDYPSASFGTQTLDPGKEYQYRFKVLGSGNLKLIYTDTDHKEHDIAGPPLKEGAEGALVITVNPGGTVSWSLPPVKQ